MIWIRSDAGLAGNVPSQIPSTGDALSGAAAAGSEIVPIAASAASMAMPTARKIENRESGGPSIRRDADADISLLAMHHPESFRPISEYAPKPQRSIDGEARTTYRGSAV